MSIASPSPASVYDLLNPSEIGYWLDSTEDDQDPLLLPLTARITSNLGSDRAVSMERPPLSEVPFLTGDGKRNSGPITLVFELYGLLPQQVRAYRLTLDDRALHANVLGFGSTRLPLLANGWALWTMTDARHMNWTCTLTLLPAGPDGYDTDGSAIPF